MNTPSEIQAFAMKVFQSQQQPVTVEISAIKNGKSSPLKAISTFYRRMDDALSHVPEKLACDGSCSYCCHYHVYVTPIEAFAIAEYMSKNFDAKEISVVSEKLALAVEQTKGMTTEEHIATNVRCPLLTDSGRCSVYEVRPTACRQHHALNRVSCEVTFHDTASTMQNLMSPFYKAVSDGFVASAASATANIGADTARYELNAALLEAINNKASFKRWRDGKNSFPSVKDRQVIA